MDSDLLTLLMYLDEGLVKNLSSLILSGYIEIRTSKLIQDRTMVGRAGFDSKESYFDEDRCGEDEREGYKGSNSSLVSQSDVGSASNASLEDREFARREEELKTIYTTFSLHSQIMNSLNTAKAVKTFNDITIQEGEVFEGDYVKIHGDLTTESVNSYLDSLLTIFDCYGCDNLNEMLTGNSNKFMNFSVMKTLLSHLLGILNKNNTEDMILNCGNTPVVINVNDNFFMNSNAYIFDKVDCPCTVFGKVIRVAKSGECISLLRKTGQDKYYEKVVNNCMPYCDLLERNGIIMPNMPRLRCDGISLIVVPISIYM